MSVFRMRAAAAVAVLAVAVCCGSVLLSSSPAEASPPRFGGVLAGPSSEYPMIGFYDRQDDNVPVCYDMDTVGNTWLLIAAHGVAGWAEVTHFSGLVKEPDTPPCQQPSTTCVNSGFQNSLVEWDTGGWR